MKFFKTPLDGAYIIELEKLEDNRGFFSRLYCSKEFNNHNLNNTFVQVNNSLSKNKGTLRGIHYQKSPMAESKLVRCISGGLYDVIVDLRANSKTYKHWDIHKTKLSKYESPVGRGGDVIAVIGLEYMRNHIENLSELYRILDSYGALSLGMDDYLASAANQYEGYVYLLTQRIKKGR